MYDIQTIRALKNNPVILKLQGMYPNSNPQPAPPSPINPDYLNQIASKTNSKPFDFLLQRKPLLYIVIGVGVFLLLMIFAATISALSGGTSTTERLAAKLVSTQAVVKDASTKIKSSDLRAYNGNLDLFLSNTIRDGKPLFAKNNIKIDGLSANAKKYASTTEMMSRLEDARLNAVYDRTYAREMAYQLSTILTLLKQVSSKTGSSQMKKFVNDSYASLQPTQKQFADFNAANG